MITIIDYGAGNLKSVEKAVKFIGCDCEITNDVNKIENAQKLILPGVGSFGVSMEKLKATGIDNAIKKAVEKNIPLFGICLGLQLLFDYSEESNCEGLGILKGKIVKIPDKGLKVPQIGWNTISISGGDIFNGIENNSYVYFVHSYYLDALDKSIVTATVDYATTLDVAVQCGNIHATQFHPEKSGEIGLKILENFVRGDS